jgi:hypothetical protein
MRGETHNEKLQTIVMELQMQKERNQIYDIEKVKVMGGKGVLRGLLMYEVSDVRIKLSAFITLQKLMRRVGHRIQTSGISTAYFHDRRKQALKICNEVNT